MLLDTKELCKELGLSSMTIYRYRKLGLPCIKVSKRVKFDKEEVIKWLKDNSKS